jgi:hypothetical protein
VLTVSGYVALRDATLMLPYALSAIVATSGVPSQSRGLIGLHIFVIAWNALLLSSVVWVSAFFVDRREHRLFPLAVSLVVLVMYGYLMVAPGAESPLYFWRPVWIIVAICSPFIGCAVARQAITIKCSGCSSAGATEHPRL